MNAALLEKCNNLKKGETSVVQINLGNKCNQTCNHCHQLSSPQGRKNMTTETAHKILDKLISADVNDIEFTGGAPELNSNLEFFIKNLSQHRKNVMVRTNLTVLDLPEYEFYADVYKENKVKLAASLPCVFEDNVDKQRGEGVFHTSVKVLKKLNQLGYGANGLSLDLVYNPGGDYLPAPQAELEQLYKKTLKEKYDISFNQLLTLVNSPIKRFRKFLERQGKLGHYLELLQEKHNPQTLDNIMCRQLISVDYAGNLYDCDFNLALNMKIKGYENTRFWEIADLKNFSPRITMAEHCFACMAGMGSSCHGTLVKEVAKTETEIKQNVKRYYGEELQTTSDLKTDACCSVESMPQHVKSALALINDEIKNKFYGCGSPIPLCLEGLRILDVGCGSGRDVYLMSKLVGETGFVHGIDMTETQLAVAQKYVKEQTEKFGFKKSNVDFILDYIENIGKHFPAQTLDIITSNCVINLAEDKEIVVKRIFDVLKWGGEFYFSDVYTDRRNPDEIKNDPVLYGECLGGALYVKDFERMAKQVGFADPRIVSTREININNPEIKKLVADTKFYSITFRLWKLPNLEDACEDYGHTAAYLGGIAESPDKFKLDKEHIFIKGKTEKVCGNTYLMLARTRFSQYFRLTGSFKKHIGLFEDCGTENRDSNGCDSGSCC